MGKKNCQMTEYGGSLTPRRIDWNFGTGAQSVSRRSAFNQRFDGKLGARPSPLRIRVDQATSRVCKAGQTGIG